MTTTDLIFKFLAISNILIDPKKFVLKVFKGFKYESDTSGCAAK